MRWRKGFHLCLAIVFALIWLAGCSDGKSNIDSKPAATVNKISEPVTLKVVWLGQKDEYDQYVNQPIIKQKYPQVTFEYHNFNDAATGFEAMIASGEKPDLIKANSNLPVRLMQVGLETDLNNLIKSTKYDLSKFPQDWISRFKRFSPKGELYVIPAEVPKDANSTVTPYMIVYNKDIFDKFAVPYPKDNLTWDEAVELAKRFNRTDGGIQYRGLQIQNYADVMVMANNPKYIDDNGTVETTSDPKWTDHLRILRAAYEANGNWLPFPGQVEEWAKNANVAMFAGQAGALIFKPEAYPDLHWDLATYPIFRKGEPGIPGFDAISVFAIASTSQHQSLVWDLINTFQSPEFAKGKPNDWENPVLLTKNTKAYTGVQLSPYTRGMWDQPLTTILRKKLAQFLNEGTDINTILREIKEEEEKKLAELKQ